jgi:putative nucleotidyltransferase with HDIG domain
MRFGTREREFAEALALVAAGQLQHDELVRADTELASLRALLAAVNARDSYTALHSRQVVTLARTVARRLGLEDAQVNEVEHVALLHDLGKIAVPDAILRKPGPLTPTEQAIMRRHPVVGAEILASTPELAYLAPAVRAEHERWDGDGYPHGLAGEAIPIASRITFVCDAYNAMTSNRPYRRAMSPDAARTEIARQSGTQFCPSCAEALVAVLGSEVAHAGTQA